jgi:hypothetical protein
MKEALLMTFLLSALAASTEPNPPIWPSSVSVFSPTDSKSDIESIVNAAFAKNGGHEPANHGQFSSARYAFMFKPGTYNVSVPVGLLADPTPLAHPCHLT